MDGRSKLAASKLKIDPVARRAPDRDHSRSSKMIYPKFPALPE